MNSERSENFNWNTNLSDLGRMCKNRPDFTRTFDGSVTDEIEGRRGVSKGVSGKLSNVISLETRWIFVEDSERYGRWEEINKKYCHNDES